MDEGEETNDDNATHRLMMHLTAEGIDNAEIASYLANLSFKELEENGNTLDLDNAITRAQFSVQRASQDLPLAEYLNNLGVMLEVRYVWTGKLQDIDEAISSSTAGG